MLWLLPLSLSVYAPWPSSGQSSLSALLFGPSPAVTNSSVSRPRSPQLSFDWPVVRRSSRGSWSVPETPNAARLGPLPKINNRRSGFGSPVLLKSPIRIPAIGSSSPVRTMVQPRAKRQPLLNLVRRLALKQQKDTPQIFLSLRQAATRFAVPVSAMATVYKKLTAEHILAGIRGSHTMLAGRKAVRHLKVRGLIGLPVSLSRFQTFLDYQRCLRRIRDELHARGFLTITIFFEKPAGQPEAVIKELGNEDVSAVIWLLPDGADQETVLRLRDVGIPFVGVNITPLGGMPCRYQVHRERAIRTIIRSWVADPKISSATIVRLAHETPTDENRLKNLQALLESEKIECEMTTVRDDHIGAFLKSICTRKSSGIILPAAAAALLGWRAPETVMEVFQTCRIALIDGAMYVPFTENAPAVTVDLVSARWSTVAERIAEELLSGEAFDDSKAVVFETKAFLGVPLNEFAEPV